MEEVLSAYKNLILNMITAVDEQGTRKELPLAQLNEMVKTYGDLEIKNRANELKEEELKVRKQELIVAEGNKLIGKAAETGVSLHNHTMVKQLTSSCQQFEKEGNVWASSISRTIPGIVTGLIKR